AQTAAAAPTGSGSTLRTLNAGRRPTSVSADHGAILEVNAHCRQAETCAAGAGESLLRDDERLREQVAAASAAGAAVSVKLRTEVDGVD
ncbi:hypothetical protein ACMYL1_23110, partial [Salmonella enterica subsp. enterica serovar Enteritidis]|uniref:hypothetical protein n=1 Tax=Salmonella enterica TaxID=28901 RepID=UPI0039EAE7D9